MTTNSSKSAKIEVSRDDLYDQVWSTPMSRLAKRYDVSGSYLARVCEALNVPRPPVGYWQKKEVGKAPPQPELPPVQPGDQIVWSKNKPIARSTGAVRQRQPYRKTAKARAGRHPILMGVEKHFLKTRKIEEEEFLRPYKTLLPDIITSEPCLEQAIKTADKVYRAFEKAGQRVLFAAPDQNLRRVAIEERERPVGDRKYGRYSVGSIWSPHRPTVTYVGDVPFGLTITEMTERSTMRYVGGKFVREDSARVKGLSSRQLTNTWTTEQDLPCGRFKLTAYSPIHGVEWEESWQETKKVTLGSMVDSIVRKLSSSKSRVSNLMIRAQEAAAQRQRDWEESQERWRRDEDRRRIEQARSESQKQLSKIMEEWNLALSTELFFREAEKRIEGIDGDRRHVLEERLKNARSMLGPLDPLEFLEAWQAPHDLYASKYSDE